MQSSDAAFVERLRQGELAAFEQLYRQHGTRLYNLACRMSGNRTDAEDLLQEIFLLAFRRLETFRGDSTLATWLYRLAVNLCVDHLRSRAARMDGRTRSLEETGWDGPMAARPDSRPLTVDRIDLERAIAQLPASCRAAFVLHDVEGFEHREVANLLGIAEGTSKSQVHKARVRIRQYLLAERSGGVSGTQDR